jgi:hypothetical protein
VLEKGSAAGQPWLRTLARGLEAGVRKLQLQQAAAQRGLDVLKVQGRQDLHVALPRRARCVSATGFPGLETLWVCCLRPCVAGKAQSLQHGLGSSCSQACMASSGARPNLHHILLHHAAAAVQYQHGHALQHALDERDLRGAPVSCLVNAAPGRHATPALPKPPRRVQPGRKAARDSATEQGCGTGAGRACKLCTTLWMWSFSCGCRALRTMMPYRRCRVNSSELYTPRWCSISCTVASTNVPHSSAKYWAAARSVMLQQHGRQARH